MTQLVNSLRSFRVLGGSGKTGRRVVEQLHRKGEMVSGVFRTTRPVFHWHDSPHNWQQLLSEVLDGRNSYTTDTLETLLGRPPVSFSHYAGCAFGTSTANANAGQPPKTVEEC